MTFVRRIGTFTLPAALALAVLETGTPACRAATHIVANDSQLAAAREKTRPGDTIILKAGEYDRIEWDRERACEQRIVVRTEADAHKMGRVRFKSLRFGGAFTTLDGLRVLGGPELRYTSAAMDGHNNRLTNCTFDDCVNKTWLTVEGYENEIDQCAFLNKTNNANLSRDGQMMRVTTKMNRYADSPLREGRGVPGRNPSSK